LQEQLLFACSCTLLLHAAPAPLFLLLPLPLLLFSSAATNRHSPSATNCQAFFPPLSNRKISIKNDSNFSIPGEIALGILVV
jgi:hypothetical protein